MHSLDTQIDTQVIPRLLIIEQTPASEIKRNYHTVVKNVPFFVTIGSMYDTPVDNPINLHHLSFEGKLLYDTEEDEGDKEVDYVSTPPLEVRRLNQESTNTNEVKLQIRIKVLSRHHENLLFRVKILALNPITGKEFHRLMTVITNPIKVISKPEKKKPATSVATPKIVNNNINRPSNPPSAQPKLTPQKRANPTDTNSVIKAITNSQIEQQKILDNLLSQISVPSVDLDPTINDQNNVNNSSDTSSADLFEEELTNFLQLYSKLPAEERPTKIRKLIRNSSHKSLEQIQNLVKYISNEAFHIPTSAPLTSTENVKDEEKGDFVFNLIQNIFNK